MFEILLTLSQAFQMMTLAPCALVIIYLLSSSKKLSFIITPLFYFLSLSAGLILSLLPAFFPTGINPTIIHGMEFAQSFKAALNYLFVLQLIIHSYPRFLHYFILAVPAIGGSSYIYLAQITPEVCLSPSICISSSYLVTYYNIFSSLFILLLLLCFISKIFKKIPLSDTQRKDKYWLVISLIVVNILLVALDLLKVSEKLVDSLYVFIQSSVQLVFIYIVLTSIFRLFTRSYAEQLVPTTPSLSLAPIRKSTLTEKELAIARRIEELMETDKLYTDLNFSRTKLANHLEIKEHHLSSIVNLAFKKSFSEFVNTYRLDAAKRLLKETDQSITAISFDTGFSNLSSFNRAFKEMTGKSPTEFRGSN